jgi:hypothetical protein
MRSLLAASFVLALGCSNACPAPVGCNEAHPSYCPCLADAGPGIDAFVDQDAFVAPADDADVDAASDIDAAAADDAATVVDTGVADDTGVDAHHP